MADITPPVSQVEGRRVPGRRQTATVTQGQLATITWVMKDHAGNPVDLTGMGTVYLRLLETLSVHGGRTAAKIIGAIGNPVKGEVSATLSADDTQFVGIYFLEWDAYTESSADPEVQSPVHVQQGHLVVNRSLAKSADLTGRGPLTLPEIRLHLRDSDPDENFLIDTLEFDDAEIIACIERCVSCFNETAPLICRRFSTTSFPYRYNWLDGTVAGLYQLAAHHYRRNSKATQAASGVTLDDKQKSAEYQQLADKMWTKYERWVQTRKASINAEACFGGTSEGGW